MSREFQVEKDNLPNFRFSVGEDAPLEAGQIRLAIDKFAFTANNLTYGVAGNMLGYWQFFPPQDNNSGKWGIIPVWAFADVIETRCEDIAAGERLYGYFPPAETLVMAPVNISKTALFDGTAHRQALPPLYNRYQRVLADPEYDRAQDTARILLGPLHMTSFCLYDKLQAASWYGAEQIILVSASSKTAMGLAQGLSQDPHAPEIVGLTSSRNVAFVTESGHYDHVLAYDDLKQLELQSAVIVDMAGNDQMRDSIQRHLGDSLAYFIGVGITHWEDFGGGGQGGPAPDPDKRETFFAPSYILTRMKELQSGEFDRRAAAYLKKAAAATFGWMDVQVHDGLSALGDIYPKFCDGTVSPAIGYVIDLPAREPD